MKKQGSITREMAIEAMALRRGGMTWKDIGRRMAVKIGRQMPFTDQAMERAVKKYIEGKL